MRGAAAAAPARGTRIINIFGIATPGGGHIFLLDDGAAAICLEGAWAVNADTKYTVIVL